MTTSLHERIRERAYRIWLDEGRPEGRELDHWDKATELVAIEDQQAATTKPVTAPSAASPDGEPVEPVLPASGGDIPTMTDQAEQTYPPRKPAARSA